MRTLEALRSADKVYAEDTRVTGKLLTFYDIKKSLLRLDENTISAQAESVIGNVLAGEIIAYCSDAGMPGISDPGMRLVDSAINVGAQVEVLPGASAVTTAYVASGFSNQNFYFGGFFPRKDAERKKVLQEVGKLDAALIYYESPKRLAASLRVIAEVFPYRQVAVCRELTKIHEEVFREKAAIVCEEFQVRTDQGTVKGEIVVVIEGISAEECGQAETEALDAAEKRAQELCQQGNISHKEITKTLQEEFGIARNDAYRIALR